MTKTPTIVSFLSIGTAIVDRAPPSRAGAAGCGSAASSTLCATSPVRTTRSRTDPGSGLNQPRCHMNSASGAGRPIPAAGKNLPLVVPEQNTEPCLANACRVSEHGLRHRLQIVRRAGDDPQDLRGCALLLQRRGELALDCRELSRRVRCRRPLARDPRRCLRSGGTSLHAARPAVPPFASTLARQAHLMVHGPEPVSGAGILRWWTMTSVPRLQE